MISSLQKNLESTVENVGATVPEDSRMTGPEIDREQRE